MNEELKAKILALCDKWERHVEPDTPYSAYSGGVEDGMEKCTWQLRELIDNEA